MAGLGKVASIPLELVLTGYKNLSSIFDEPFDGLGITAEIHSEPLLPNDALPMNVQRALDVIYALEQPSQVNEIAPFSSTPQRWLSQRPNLELYDSEVINVFLNLAVSHLGRTFTFLESFAVQENTRPELYLAVAAIGGLFCQVTGSYKVAEAMYHDSRRLLHEIVSSPLRMEAKRIADV